MKSSKQKAGAGKLGLLLLSAPAAQSIYSNCLPASPKQANWLKPDR
jgi:hypothetical protein